MATLTEDALLKHIRNHTMSQSSRETRVTVHLMSGQIVGFRCMGESQETVLTFPGSFRVADALAEGNVWVRRAEPHEQPDYKRLLKEGTEVNFIKTAPIRLLCHSTMQQAFGSQIMAVNGQEHMFGFTTDAPQPKEDFTEAAKLINLDGIKTPTTPSESGAGHWC